MTAGVNGGWTSDMAKKGWETRKAKMIANGWVPPEQRVQKPPRTISQHPVTASTRIKLKRQAEQLEAGTLHIVADVRMRIRQREIWTECSCGARFAEGTVDATAEAFNQHSYEARRALRGAG